jgi:tRNA threonylcarbamoyladenosine biosynthesis protein TsaE
MAGETVAHRFQSPEALMDFAAEFSASVGPGSVIALCGPLGAGKTHFTKGFARGLGCEETVSSPTFSLVQEYHGGRLPIFHFDLYRAKSAAEALDLGWDDYTDQGGVCIVEWADLFPQIFPENTLWMQLDALGETERQLSWRIS